MKSRIKCITNTNICVSLIIHLILIREVISNECSNQTGCGNKIDKKANERSVLVNTSSRNNHNALPYAMADVPAIDVRGIETDNVVEEVRKLFHKRDIDDYIDLDHRGLTERRKPRAQEGTPPTRSGQNRAPVPIQLRTPLGVILGSRELSIPASVPSAYGRPYFSFRGIPFAEPPIGDLRWAAPVLYDQEWPGGQLDATQFRSFCAQFDHDKKTVVGSEDCLFLNVYTPFLRHETNVLLPVMVFIHGGAYSRGAASAHGPQRLMTKNIVVVTVNYRLGALGFLATNTEDLPGNYGALDQVVALQWVNKYISYFNGNPAQVTLAGFSAGASFVHMHILSSLSQGLFQRAIMMSGAGNCGWSVQNEPLEVAEHFAEDLDCPSPPGYSFLTCLRNKTVYDIVTAQTNRHRYVYWPFLYRPVVDGGLRERPFLSASIEELMTQLPPSGVPVLGGVTAQEGLLFALTTILFSSKPESASQVHDEAAMYLLSSLWPNVNSSEDVAAVLHSYYYTPEARDSLDVLLQQMTEVFTDQLFTSCIWDALDHLASTRASPVYAYVMDHHDRISPAFAYSLYSLAYNLGIRSPLLHHGVSHGDDIVLMFMFPHSQVQPGPRDQQMSTMLIDMWTNFVTNGAPVSGQLSNHLPPWPPISSGEVVPLYNLSLTPSSSSTPYRKKERILWSQSLKVVEHISQEKVEAEEQLFHYQVSTWVLLALCLLLLLVLLILVIGIVLSKRRKKYSARGATLRSNKPRPVSSYGPP